MWNVGTVRGYVKKYVTIANKMEKRFMPPGERPKLSLRISCDAQAYARTFVPHAKITCICLPLCERYGIGDGEMKRLVLRHLRVFAHGSAAPMAAHIDASQ